MPISSSPPSSWPSLLQEPTDSDRLFHPSEDGSTPGIEAKAASALALGLGQRLELLSKQSGALADASRLSACVAAMVCQSVLQGHVCMPLNVCAPRLGLDVGMLREALLRSGVVCGEQTAPYALLPLVLDSGDRLYLARYYDYERRLALQLSAVIRTPLSAKEVMEPMEPLEGKGAALPLDSFPQQSTMLEWRETVNHYCNALGLADHQRLAVALTVLNRLTLISGGPGTGKTTTTMGLLACLLERDPTLRIALAAPTGRAAQHLFHALTNQASRLSPDLALRLPQKAFTVHRLLSERTQASSIAAGSSNSTTSKKIIQAIHHAGLLPYDVIVIDEASMLDVVLATQLVEALPAHARLILLGDKHQLSAVEAGEVFASLTTHSRFTSEYLDRLALLLPENQALLEALRLRHLHVERPKEDALKAASAEQLDFDFENSAPINPAIAAMSKVSTASPQADISSESSTEHSIHALQNCSVELERNYRFAKESPIGRLAQAIRDADAESALAIFTYLAADSQNIKEQTRAEEGGFIESAIFIEENAPSHFPPSQPSAAMLPAAALAHLAQGFDTYFDALQAILFRPQETLARDDTHTAAMHTYFDVLSTALHTYRVLCPIYEGPRGVGALNAGLDRLFRSKLLAALHQWHTHAPHAYLRQMRTALEQAAHAAPIPMQNKKGGAIPQSFTLYAGLPLMVTRNDYSLDLFNGDIGIVLPRQIIRQALPSTDYVQAEGEEGALQVLFYKADKSVRIISPSLLPPWRAAFAMTIHKSQGSEFNHIALVLPSLADHPHRYPLTSLTRAMLYTAITRARHRVTLLGNAPALEAAIHTSTPLYSGLQARLNMLLS